MRSFGFGIEYFAKTKKEKGKPESLPLNNNPN
jgi:hypothetical protein